MAGGDAHDGDRTRKKQLAALNKKLRADTTRHDDVVLRSQDMGPSAASPVPLLRAADQPMPARSHATPTSNNSRQVPTPKIAFDATSHELEGEARATPARNITVAVRTRPMTVGEEQLGCGDCISIDSCAVTVSERRKRIDLTPYTVAHRYEVHAAYDHRATNGDVYKRSFAPLVRRALDGAHVACFTYGATGTGKSHTVFGNEFDMGLCRLAASDVLKNRSEDAEVLLSFFEVQGNSLWDLLGDGAALCCREGTKGTIQVVGLSRHVTPTLKSFTSLLNVGLSQRRLGADGTTNACHSVVEIATRNKWDSELSSRITIVDVGGSEGDGCIKEEGRALHALRECLRAINTTRGHIPYRSSRLTEVLRESFVGVCPTLMVATVSPSEDCVESTLHVLRCARSVWNASPSGGAQGRSGRRRKSIAQGSPVPAPAVPASLSASREVSQLRMELQRKEVQHAAEIRTLQDRIRSLVRENDRLRRKC